VHGADIIPGQDYNLCGQLRVSRLYYQDRTCQRYMAATTATTPSTT
jgi:hypothetical protein